MEDNIVIFLNTLYFVFIINFCMKKNNYIQELLFNYQICSTYSTIRNIE